MVNTLTTLILASTSPRRRDLVGRFDLPFQFASVDVDETLHAHEQPEALVRRLSRAKAEHGVAQHPGAVVVAADTIVALDDTILGKPCDSADAVRMLRRLRARAHVVYTGLVVAQGERRHSQVATTTVVMRNYSDAEIDAYVATGDPLDKAAAYAIQHAAFHPVDHIDGCHSNVMGLPLCRLYVALKEFGIVSPDPDRVLKDPLERRCPAAQALLSAGRPAPRPIS